MLFQIDHQLFGYNTVYRSSRLTVPQLLLRLSLKLRLPNLDAHNSSQAFTDIFPRKGLCLFNQLI